MREETFCVQHKQNSLDCLSRVLVSSWHYWWRIRDYDLTKFYSTLLESVGKCCLSLSSFFSVTQAPGIWKSYSLGPTWLAKLWLFYSLFLPQIIITFKQYIHNPGWCGSVDWVPACELKGRQLDSQSGHMPGLRARSPSGGVQEVTDQHSFPSLSPFLPLSLKNK